MLELFRDVITSKDGRVCRNKSSWWFFCRRETQIQTPIQVTPSFVKKTVPPRRKRINFLLRDCSGTRRFLREQKFHYSLPSNRLFDKKLNLIDLCENQADNKDFLKKCEKSFVRQPVYLPSCRRNWTSQAIASSDELLKSQIQLFLLTP